MEMQEFFMSCAGIRDPELAEYLAANAYLRTVEKRDILVEQGEVPTYVYILWKGIIRGFVPRYHGDDLTESFIFTPGSPIYWNEEDLQNEYETESPSGLIYQAMTPCKVVVLPVALVRQLLDQSIELNRLFRKLMMDRIHFHMENKYIRSHSAIVRYHWFLQRFPELADGRVQDQYIASFLDITPATFSRLKKQ